MRWFIQKIRSVFKSRVCTLDTQLYWTCCLATGFLALNSNVARAQPCNEPGAWVVSVEGQFSVGGNLARMGDQICVGDEISVGHNSRGAIRLVSSQTVIRIDQNTSFVVEPSSADESWLRLFRGILYLFSRQPESFSIEAPYVNAAIEGTEFVISASTESNEVTVIEGSVRLSNARGSVSVLPGQAANAGPDQAPGRRTVIDPQDAVQWALYFPSIGAAENTSESVRSAADLLARGNIARAEALLTTLPDDAAALALSSIIAVTQNRTEDALRLAQRSVQIDPASSIAYTALSYAQQSVFAIDEALHSAELAVRNDAENTDALVRKAELLLGIDQTAEALASAREAVKLDPDNSRARTLLGFVYLVRLTIDDAHRSFSAAIDLDPGDPLPRLGLGLALIRQGQLIAGRRHIEVAAILDPADALVRSYLGKAYFQEGQTEDASTQFELAKARDPQDPTAWLYDALLSKALNRPVTAYEKLNRARELNGNRLIYQSRLLVDKSDAAGSSSLASIYSELGFDQLAINESTRSITTDPTNYSAYRLLADSYAVRVRHESARRNVIFQASLLQPMSINPVQPYAQQSDLLLLPETSPVHPAINEYSPLFDQQGFRLSGSLVAGNEKTLGDNLVLSGLHDRFSYSLGQFHFENEGFRPNNDIEHDIYSGFVQVQASPELYIQAELSSRQTSKGDLSLNFNDDQFSRDLRTDIESDSPRIGIRARLSPITLLLLSTESIDRSEKAVFTDGPFTISNEQHVSGYQGSARLIRYSKKFSQSVGIDSYDIEFDDEAIFTEENGESFSGFMGNEDSLYTSAYYYANINAGQGQQWTIGLNYSQLEDDQLGIDTNSLDPKIGFRWSINQNSELRLALGRGQKRNSNFDRTLEPTLLAGFNQLYDDFVGTEYLNTGVGLDKRAGDLTRYGFEILHRELDVPRLIQLDPGSPEFTTIKEAQQETTARGYFYRILDANTWMSIELLYEKFKRSDAIRDNAGESVIGLPLSVETLTLPLRIGFSNPAGFFIQARVSVVDQSVQNNAEGNDTITDSDRFAIADLQLGFNCPSRRRLNTTFAIDIFNVLDQDFNFQDHNIQSSRETTPRFSPGRSILGRVSFLFQ